MQTKSRNEQNAGIVVNAVFTDAELSFPIFLLTALFLLPWYIASLFRHRLATGNSPVTNNWQNFIRIPYCILEVVIS